MNQLLVSLALCLLSLSGQALAQGAPKQLYNKSILISWVQDETVREPNGRLVTPHVQGQRQVYISSAGRLFVKSSMDVRNRAFHASDLGHRAPNEASRPGALRFQGASLVGIFPYVSGARRIVVTFDANFTSCTLDVTFGKTGGQNIVWKRTGDKAIREIVSVRAVNQTCSIRDGNVFASN